MIISDLFDRAMITFGDTVLKSGKVSPIYINLRPLPSYPRLLREVAKEMLRKVHSEQFLGTKLAGLPVSGLPIAVAMGLIGDVPVLYPRPKEIPGKMNVEGKANPGEEVIVIDDVLTDGVIKKAQIDMIRRSGLFVRDVLVVVDRGEGGRELLEGDGVRVHSLYGLREIVEVLRRDSNLATYEYNRVLNYEASRLSS